MPSADPLEGMYVYMRERLAQEGLIASAPIAPFAMREARGWSIKRLALEAGVTERAIRKLERGLTEKMQDRLVGKIARALGVAPERYRQACERLRHGRS